MGTLTWYLVTYIGTSFDARGKLPSVTADQIRGSPSERPVGQHATGSGARGLERYTNVVTALADQDAAQAVLDAATESF